MWKLDHKEGWVPKNWCFQTVVLEKTFESRLDNKEIKPINTKGNQFWIFIGRTDAEAEAPILWPPHVKSQLIGKDPDAGKDWRQKEKGKHRTRWFDNITDSMDVNLTKLWETVEDRGAQHAALGSQRDRHNIAAEQRWQKAGGKQLEESPSNLFNKPLNNCIFGTISNVQRKANK